jgi:hypothetical protein
MSYFKVELLSCNIKVNNKRFKVGDRVLGKLEAISSVEGKRKLALK